MIKVSRTRLILQGGSVAHHIGLWHHAILSPSWAAFMATLLEYVGNIHIFLGPYRGNPIALYLKRDGNAVQIAPKVYPWSAVVGQGETPNRAAADFEEKWKGKGLAAEMYTGPHWEGGIKPEKPTPPKPAAAEKPASAKPGPAAPKPAAATAASPAAPTSGPDPSGTTGDAS
jgi:hypothetical protein